MVNVIDEHLRRHHVSTCQTHVHVVKQGSSIESDFLSLLVEDSNSHGKSYVEHLCEVGNSKEKGPIGTSVMHRSALIQCTGEAVYVDDMPSPPKTLHGAFVLSSRPNGKILNIDATEALKWLNEKKTNVMDVTAFYTASAS